MRRLLEFSSCGDEWPCQQCVNGAYPRAGSTAMPTGLPAPVGEPLLVIRVFLYCTSPLNFKTCSSAHTKKCLSSKLNTCSGFLLQFIAKTYSNLNRLRGWICVVKVQRYPVQSQANRGAKHGCRGKLCPVSAVWLHPVDLTLRDRGKLTSATQQYVFIPSVSSSEN